MRRLAIVCVTLLVSACSGSSTGPSSVGTVVDIAGTWSGTFTSSNNPPEQVNVNLTQNGSNVTGTWQGTSVAWQGEISGSMSGSSLSGQLTFTGRTIDDTVCTGTANFSGSVTTTSMSLTSSNGVAGASCPAALPVGIQIDLRR